MRYLFLLFILISHHAFSQPAYKTESKKAIKFYEEGLRNYNLKYYPVAEQYLKDAIAVDEQFQNAYLVLAEVYWEQGKYAEAVNYYSEGLAIDPTLYPLGYLNKGKLEIKIAKYTDAKASFRKYLELEPENPKYSPQAKRGIKQADFAIHAVENPVDFEPVNLGPNVNTRTQEYWPSLSADGQTLVITRLVDYYDITMGSRVQEDFFFSRFEDGEWKPMKNAGPPLNTSDNEGAQSISADGKFMAYTVCNRKGVIGRCDIFYADKQGDKWTEPKNMGEAINSTAKETQPSLSADGRSIYFASDRTGGKGGLDIYRSHRNDDGTWSTPENLGDSINTPGDEMSPFIHHDNNTLYFSSDYHLGMGGFDLFMSKRNDNDQFTKVTNLGYPINTSGDEVGLIVNAKGNIAYYASEMIPENGKDIYQFTLYEEARPQEVSYMKGVVYDVESRKRLKAEFELYDLATGDLISKSHSEERTGEFLLCIPTDKNYMLNVDKKGYLFFSENFALKGIYQVDEPYLKDVPLNPIRIGESIVLRNVFFETDSYTLLPESKYELNKVINFLEKNPQLKVEISGHTDNVGTESYNKTLSAQRAKSVVDFLVSNGISANRLESAGYGFSQPVESNETEEGRAANRRTELRIINQ